MALLAEWQAYAEAQGSNKQTAQMFWANYFNLEKEFYEKLLETDEVVTGTVQELADKYEVELKEMAGFLDGINDSLVTPNPIDTMEADTVVSL